MNKFKRFAALALVLCMVLTMVPFSAAATESASDSYAYSIVHVDAGRKYFSVENLKTIIDNAAAAGFNQVELYLSDNQGFRFALDDMTLTTGYGTYDLTGALGDGYSDGSKHPDGTDQYLTQGEMDEIISYANGRQIDIVPCINIPGHMGAILEEFPSFRYSTSSSSIDLDNEEAVAFALALTEKYAKYFASRGCKYYNVGADEYANDMSSMGFEGMGADLYTKFVELLNDAADIILAEGMIPRAFNDGFYYKDYSISVEPNKAYEICYWTSGWWGYDVASASTIAAKGHKMINTNGDYYWVLGDSTWQCSAEKAAQFDQTVFSGSTISNPAGSMFCIWCDVANADGRDGGTAVVADTAAVISAFGAALPETASLVDGDDGAVSDELPEGAGGEAVPANARTAATLTMEFWITNARVETGEGTSKVLRNTDEGIQSADGVDVTTLAPASGTSSFGTMAYWKTVRLDKDNIQTGNSSDDETGDGTAMTHIRYYNGAWQYKVGQTWNYFLTTDQLVAYYLQKTDVTDQIVTLTKDWGYPTSSTTPSTSDGKGQVALSVAVVDGSTLTPTEENIYASSTTIFNYWENRDIGIVAPKNNSNYEIYKITVTEGTRTKNQSANVWYAWDTITWEKTANDLGTGVWYNEREIWNITEGTEPMAHGINDDIVWKKKNTAFLILFYIRATNANLTVKYVDDSLDGALIYERGVFADQGESFYDLSQTSSVPTTDGAFTLDDNATLTYHNYETDKDVVQTFEKSLLNFQDIQPQYRSGAYEYVGAEIDDDGGTLILHYDIDETKLNPKYVVDFGLSVSVDLSDVIENYADVQTASVVSAAYGTAVVADGVLTYTPNAVLQAPAAVPVKVTYANGSVAVRNVGFIPATTMNYEEGFAAFSGSWSGGSTGSGGQALQTASNVNGNYGYDAKYAAETGMTNGTQAISADSGDKAELSFTGTGIDVYANCDESTSTVAVLLYKADGTLVKMYQVDTSAVSGTSAATDGQNITSYSLPIVSIQGLTHGSYKVVIQHTKPSGDDAEFRLDGFRVYNTLVGEATADYAADENDPAFLELRSAVLKGADITESSKSDPYNWSGALVDQVYKEEGSLTGALVLSSNENYDVQDLLENGPKNELFLQPGDAVTFTVSGTAQIGLKALNGKADYTLNGSEYSVTTSADMFYHEGVSGEVSIVNTGSAVLSLTKLKLFGALGQITAEQVVSTLNAMGLGVEGEVPGLPAVPENPVVYDEAVVTVDVVDYKGTAVAQVTLNANGVQGESHTFTAAEILAAVKAQLPASYALVDESAVKDVRVNYGKTGSAMVTAGLTAVVQVTYVGMLNNTPVGEAEIVVVQTGGRSWCQITAAQIRANAPAGYRAVCLTGIKAAYGYSYRLVVPVI